MFAGPIIAYFKTLPTGIRMDGDRIWVDLHTLLRSQGLDEAVPFLKSVRVLTREQRFLVQFDLRR
jgi:hypothetical protein